MCRYPRHSVFFSFFFLVDKLAKTTLEVIFKRNKCLRRGWRIGQLMGTKIIVNMLRGVTYQMAHWREERKGGDRSKEKRGGRRVKGRTGREEDGKEDEPTL